MAKVLREIPLILQMNEAQSKFRITQGKNINNKKSKQNVRRQHRTTRSSLSSLTSTATSTQLFDDYEALKKQNVKVRKQRDAAIASSKILQDQQTKIYDDFKLLRDKYDDLKSEMHQILWDFLPKYCPKSETFNNHNSNTNTDDHCHYSPTFHEFSQVDHTVFETVDRIGDYAIGKILGEGQYADVKLCTNLISCKEFAVKVLPKSKVVTLAGLKRIHTELSVLKRVHHSNIIKFVDYIHSPESIYLMTEVAGKDLFEFFDTHPMGVKGEIAKEIMLGIVSPIIYLHSIGICHRDLKPENVLLDIDASDINSITRNKIQICDFGQCAENTDKERMFDDLCGSPGFFAPEMILDERYNGIAADVWSIGCIMLELTRGHDEFCNFWMTSYDYEILQNERSFEYSLRNSIRKINEIISQERRGATLSQQSETMSSSMANFLNKLLTIDPSSRIDSSLIPSQPWLNGELPPRSNLIEGNDRREYEEKIIPSNFNSPCSSTTTKTDRTPTETQRQKTRFLRDSMSNRARRHFSKSSIDNLHIVKDSFGEDHIVSFKETAPNRSQEHSFTNDDLPSSINPGTPQQKVQKKNRSPSRDSKGEKMLNRKVLEVRLPPIEPATPSCKVTKNIVLEGRKLVKALVQDGQYNCNEKITTEIRLKI